MASSQSCGELYVQPGKDAPGKTDAESQMPGGPAIERQAEKRKKKNNACLGDEINCGHGGVSSVCKMVHLRTMSTDGRQVVIGTLTNIIELCLFTTVQRQG